MAYLGQDIPKLGFGLMRLPMVGETIDIEQTKTMVDMFLAKGFTYFDTAFSYINEQSQVAIKEALVDRYPRDSFQLATKLPAWLASSKEEAEAMFTKSLERCGVDYFDFYLLHNLGAGRTEAFYTFDIWAFLAEQKKAGRIKHLGFSMHDKADFLDAILTKHPDMEFVQLQINYADWEDDVVESRKCYEVARKHGKPVVIMEPVKGGVLADLPQPVAKIFNDANPDASPASWGIRFAASLEGVITVLSGMSNVEQMQDNLTFMENFRPLSADERTAVEKAQKALAAIPSIPCTSCQYCVKDCPQHINIPGVFRSMNFELVYDSLERAKGTYAFECKDSGKAGDCIACGQCEMACPQSIHIIEALAKASKLFDVDKVNA